MSFIKRLTATLSANVDHAISQIENHDAVVDAVLYETRDAAARLKVQLSRAHAETRRLSGEIARLDSEERQWVQRAKRVAVEDEQRAMACLRHRDACREQRASLASRHGKHREIEHRLEGDLARLSKRLEEINTRRQELRGRELSARGSRAVADLQRESALDVDRAFERWEVEVTRSEIGSEVEFASGEDPPDDLAEDFERAERDAAHRDELKKLLSEGED